MNFRLLIICAATSAALLSACSSNPVADGDEAYKAGDWNKALSVYENALSKGDVNRADVGSKIDDCKSKLSAAERTRAESLLQKSDFDAAVAAVGSAEKLSPGDPDNAALLKKARQAARSDLEKKADKAAAAGDAQAAVALLDQGRKWADDFSALNAKALAVLCDSAEKALAAGEFQKASSMAQAATGREQGNARAEAVLKALAEKKAQVDDLMKKAQDARQDGKYEEAAVFLVQALAAWPGHPEAEALATATKKERDFWNFFRAGDTHLSRKEWAKAVEFFEKAREVDPLPTVAAKLKEASFGRWMEEAAQLERDRKAEAVAALEKALEFTDEKAPIEARIRSMKYSMFLDEGMAHEVKGEWIAALAAYEKAAGFADDRAEINRRMISVRDHIVTVKCDKCSGTGKVDDYRIEEKNGNRDMVKVGVKDCPDCAGKGSVQREKQ